jgi:hypothetical protein
MTSGNPLYRLLGKSFLIEWLFAFFLVIIARVPYLLSDHVYFDGDEAMLGIMGRDLITGRNIPFYFYGQQYGFSFFEALSAGFFILFLGSTVWSLKFGGMLLFSLGIQRLFRVLRTYQVSIAVFLFTAFILVAFPTWVVWATKLRGGYVTAFVGVCFILEQLLVHKNWTSSNWAVVSMVSAIVLVSQPFFILPVSLLLIKRFFTSERQLMVTSMAVGIGSLVLLRSLALLNPNYWNPPMAMTFNFSKLNKHLTDNLISNFTGYFAFWDNYEVPDSVAFGATAFLTGVGGWFLLVISRSSKDQVQNTLLILFGSAISTLALPLFVHDGGRYLLPFFSGVLLMIVMLTISNKNTLLFSVILSSALIPTLNFADYTSYWLEAKEPDMKRLDELVQVLEERDLRYGFVSEWQLIWQLNYLGNDEMAFRYQTIAERVPRFIEQANECYSDTSCTPVLVGGLWPLLGMETVPGWNEKIEKVNARYYIMENPDTVFLNKGGFELP